MKNFPIEHEGKTYWISRAVAVVGLIFTYKNDRLFVLANKRGKGTPDFQGYWNCPCGYLDFDETIPQACCREIDEETNLKVFPKDLFLYGINDDPKDEHQNITFRYWSYSTRYAYEPIYAKGEEQDEVEEVRWIPVDELNCYDFAFNQKSIIIGVVGDYLSSLVSTETLLKLRKSDVQSH